MTMSTPSLFYSGTAQFSGLVYRVTDGDGSATIERTVSILTPESGENIRRIWASQSEKLISSGPVRRIDNRIHSGKMRVLSPSGIEYNNVINIVLF